MNINTQQLRYFMELAKCLNFTRAAANLYVAQPTLSQQIADLESQLGIALFTRSSRSVALTPAGAILQAAYPNLVTQMKQIRQHMLSTAAGFSGTLTIGFLDVFMGTIPQVIREFRKVFPDIDILPVEGTPNELHERLKNQTIDVALTLIHDFDPESQAGFSTKLMTHDTMCFVLPGDLDVSGDYVFTESLPLLHLSDSTAACHRTHITHCLNKLGIRIQKAIPSDSVGGIRAYLESGAGYTVLPATMATFFSPSTRFVPVPNEHLNYGALWNPDSRNPALPLFLEALDQFLNPGSETDLP